MGEVECKCLSCADQKGSSKKAVTIINGPPVNLCPLSPYVQRCLSLFIRRAIAEESEPGLARMKAVFGLLLGFRLVAASPAQSDRLAKPGKMCKKDTDISPLQDALWNKRLATLEMI